MKLLPSIRVRSALEHRIACFSTSYDGRAALYYRPAFIRRPSSGDPFDLDLPLDKKEMETQAGSNQSEMLPQPRQAWISLDESKPAPNRRTVPRIKIVHDDMIERMSVTSVHHGVETWIDDQPGCSGIQEISRQVEETVIEEMTEHEEKTGVVKQEDPLDAAWNDLVERVSVAGWQEAFHEKILWIRGCYRIILVILSIICVYYISGSVSSFVQSGYIDEINDFAMNESLPFPNVTVCAQVYFNQTFIRHNLTIPKRTMEVLRHQNTSIDDFYRQLAIYLTPVIRPQNFSMTNLALFSKVIAANPQTADYSSFATDAWLRCESMLRRCWFDGQQFDCCSKAVTSFDDDGICFQLALNMDSDNAFPDKRTFRQTTPGPNGGLDIEVSVDTHDFPWLEDDAQNGFRILVGHTSLVDFSSPVVAPHGAETYIKVTPEKRVLATNCAARNQLKLPFSKEEVGYYYDPEGINCGTNKMQDVFLRYTACHVAIYMVRPNRTIVCPLS